jgi:outer membrane protein OmpA-like peptidoglycan-associated protein
MWIRQVARVAQDRGACLAIVGHTSATGTEAANNRLSEQRALTVRRQLERTAPALAPRLSSRGVGASEADYNFATVDNDANASDRKVVFNVVDCPARVDLM